MVPVVAATCDLTSRSVNER
uniref:Uncharacterized protein n=1 Tax=Rhizophora mucronata TaxID=61149 RepID=A0A2P2MDX6_RHIMU